MWKPILHEREAGFPSSKVELPILTAKNGEDELRDLGEPT